MSSASTPHPHRQPSPSRGHIKLCSWMDYEMPHTNCSLFCLALGNDASPAAPKPKLLWVGLLAKLSAGCAYGDCRAFPE